MSLAELLTYQDMAVHLTQMYVEEDVLVIWDQIFLFVMQHTGLRRQRTL